MQITPCIINCHTRKTVPLVSCFFNGHQMEDAVIFKNMQTIHCSILWPVYDIHLCHTLVWTSVALGITLTLLNLKSALIKRMKSNLPLGRDCSWSAIMELELHTSKFQNFDDMLCTQGARSFSICYYLNFGAKTHCSTNGIP